MRRIPLWALAIALATGKNTIIICPAGPERDTIFHLRVTVCREQGSHCRDERLAWVASQWQGRKLVFDLPPNFDASIINCHAGRSKSRLTYHSSIYGIALKFKIVLTFYTPRTSEVFIRKACFCPREHKTHL